MAQRPQEFKKTSFKKQAEALSGFVRTDPMIDDAVKASMQETVGVLTWINQLQLHWAAGGKDVPPAINAQLFEGREPQGSVAEPIPA